MGRAFGTDAASAASKNTSRPKFWPNFSFKPNLKSDSASRAGREHERKVREFLEHKNWKFIAANRPIQRIEIDLLMQNPKGELCIIEVKSLQSPEYFERRITPNQVKRIRHALRSLLERNQPARAHLACVRDNQIDLYEDFFVQNL